MSAPRSHNHLFALAFLFLAALPCPAGEKTEEPKPPVAPWTVTKDSGWKELETGLELREETLDWKRQQDNALLALILKLTAVRFDPKRFAMQIRMNPVKREKTLANVAKAEKAPVVSNGAYFGKKDEPVTLLISDGKELGKPSTGLPLSGVFTLDERGRAAVRPLKEVQPPYDGIAFAVQNSPLLVAAGKAAFREKPPENPGKASAPPRYRRTALGTDAEGRVVLLVCDSGIHLAEFAEVLASAGDGGFALESAVNLDGGPSSGLAVEHQQAKVDVPAGRIIPHVILVSRREQPLAAEPAGAGSTKQAVLRALPDLPGPRAASLGPVPVPALAASARAALKSKRAAGSAGGPPGKGSED